MNAHSCALRFGFMRMCNEFIATGNETQCAQHNKLSTLIAIIYMIDAIIYMIDAIIYIHCTWQRIAIR